MHGDFGAFHVGILGMHGIVLKVNIEHGLKWLGLGRLVFFFVVGKVSEVLKIIIIMS